jgi:glycosyltransferase involved in cell wall biosynthesis
MYQVAILLSTFNGEKFIKDQLISFSRQKKVKIKLFVIDDGSTDNTIKIIKRFNIPKKIFKTKNFRNPTKNFLFLIDNVPINFDFYCFADQDDYWFSNKLSYSISQIKKNNSDICGSRTIYTNNKLKVTGKSILFKKKPSLENSLVQSIAGGNTQLWTKKFNNVLKKIKKKNPASHDWYTYQVALLFGFNFLYIEKPLLYYRQHENNVVGSNVGIKNTLKRIFLGFSNRYKNWHEMNKVHLYYIIKNFNINEKNFNIVNNFYKYKNQNIISRIINIFFKLKIYRQTTRGNLMLFFALIFKKV